MQTKKNTKNAKEDIFVSVVLVPRRNAQDISDYCERLAARLLEAYTNYEVIVIDNAIDPITIQSVIALLESEPCFRVIRLSRAYSHDTAVMAGIEAAIGDYVVIANPALDPLDAIFAVVQKNKKADVVQGISDIKPGRAIAGSFLRRAFYWYNRRYLNIDIPTQATYLIGLSRRAVRAITTSNRFDGHIRHIVKTIGYTHAEHLYHAKEDPTRTASLKTGVVEALEIVSSHSTHPLRFMSWVGFFASMINLAYAIYVVVVALIKPHVAEGWTTMSLQLSGMFFILFLFMVVLSEYVGKILNEARRDARYLVMDELASTVSLADVARKNIAKE